MIKIIDEEFELLNQFKSFCKLNSFGTRIYSHFLCYGYKFDFVDFWAQIDDEMNVVATFCRLDGEFVVSLCDKSDFEEITFFLNFQDKRSITFDIKYADLIKINYGSKSVGDVLIYEGNNYKTAAYDIISPELKDYHALLSTCKSNDFFVPDYMSFLSDTSRRRQKQMCDIYGIVADGTLVSCAMTVSYTDFSTILGAVATHPQHRKHGYAGCVVKLLAEKSRERGNVYIYTTVKRNTEFYKSLGFVVTENWIKYTMEDDFE